MSTRLYLVRHGATPQTAEQQFSGSDNVELSDEGRAQAARLGERLRDERCDAVYSSSMARAMETARIVSSGWSLPPVAVSDLREVSHGHWEGLGHRDVEQQFADEFTMWEADPFSCGPRGGETGANVLARALPAILQIVANHHGQRVLVVSHKATIRLILCGLLGVDPRRYRDRFDQSPACLNIIDFKNPLDARLILFNDTSHYSNIPISS